MNAPQVKHLVEDIPKAHQAILDEAIVELGIDSLAAFVVRAWEIVEPGTPLVWNWHLDVLCRELRRVPEEVDDLVINIPPGMMKSLMVSVFWPAWLWLRDPSERYLTFANKDNLAARDSRRMRTIIQSDWYCKLVHIMHDRYNTPLWRVASDQNEKVSFDLVTGDPFGKRDKGTEKMLGGRACNSLQSNITGQRCSGMLIDDPLDVKDVIKGSPEKVRARVSAINDVVEKVLPTRMNKARPHWRVIIMQRLHVDDPAQRAIDSGAHPVVLPMRYEADHPDAYPDDPRQEGQLLCPSLFDDKDDELMRSSGRLGPKHYGAQYRQRPSEDEGGLFQAQWFDKRYSFDAQRAKWDRIEIHIDASFKRATDTDFVALEAIGFKDGDFYWLDVVNRRMNYPELKQAKWDMVAKWPRANVVVIEDKANGPALIDDLARDRKVRKPGTGTIPDVPVVPYNPTDSKYARAQVASDFWEAGRCWLPAVAPWVQDFIDQHVSFPGGTNDDMVDAGSQCLCRAAHKDGKGKSAAEVLEKKFGYLM